MKDKIIGVVLLALSLVSGYTLYEEKAPQAEIAPRVGATNFKFAQLQPYALYGGGAVAGATSITLKSMKDIDGNTLTMAGAFGAKGYGTLEPGKSTQEEQISFTGLVNNSNGTVTLSGVSHVAFLSPYTETSGLTKTHPGSSTFVISNTSGFYNQFVAKDNDGTISQNLIFTSTAQPQYDTNPAAWASQNSLINKAYADALAFQGAATSTFSALGLVQLAGKTQVGSSTASSSFGGPLVIPNSFATTTPGPQCAAGVWNCVVASYAGKISQSFFDLTASWTFTNLNAASSTFTGKFALPATAANPVYMNGLPYVFPFTAGASTTMLSTDGSGNLSFEKTNPYPLIITSLETSTVQTSTTTAATITIPAGLLRLDNYIEINSQFDSVTNSCSYSLDIGNGSATSTVPLGGSNGVAKGILMAQGPSSEKFGGFATFGNTIAGVKTDRGVLTYATSSNIYLALTWKAISTATCYLEGYSAQVFRTL